MNRTARIALLLTLLAGCDRLAERAGMPDPAKVEAEGKAIGAACRHAGRGLEDCFQLNERAAKPAIYAGWKEMNEYMMKNNMESIEPGAPLEAGKTSGRKKAMDKATNPDAEVTDPDKKGNKPDPDKKGNKPAQDKETAH